MIRFRKGNYVMGRGHYGVIGKSEVYFRKTMERTCLLCLHDFGLCSTEVERNKASRNFLTTR